jgi:DNA polymerase III subunit gamma/tau
VQQPAENPAGPTEGKAVTQHEIQQNWQRIRQMVKNRNSLTAAALNSCKSFVLKENTLILGFQSEVVKLKMETPENIEILRQALQTIMGANLGVRCIVTGSRSNQASELDVDGDGMVGTALDLGGKIVYED